MPIFTIPPIGEGGLADVVRERVKHHDPWDKPKAPNRRRVPRRRVRRFIARLRRRAKR